MFRLVRFFLLTSAIVLAVIAGAVVLYRQNEVERLIDFAESQNVTLARSFANTIWPRFASYVRSSPGLNGDSLQARPETREFHEALKTLTTGLPVLKVKIYNLDGLTVYSSELSEIGVYKINNPGLVSAARKGIPASKLTFRDTVSSFEGTMQDRDLVESYLPIRYGNAPIEGVFELYSDVTPLVARIKSATMNLVIGFVLVFGVLYGALFLIVRRADNTIKQQYADIAEKNAALEHEVAERKQAETALKKAHDELEQRVDERTRDLRDEIAERKQAEESLRKLSRAVEQSPAMTIITDPDGTIEYVNPRFTEVTGYTLAEIAGKTPRILKSGEMLPEAYKELWKTITAGGEWRGEIRNRKKNGELYWALTSISPVTGQDGTVTHLLGISEDITEKKRTEDEARQQRSELAHAGRVIIVGEMATSLAHELNQPLTVISGCAQICMDRLRSDANKPSDLLDAAQKVIEQAERAKNIIHRIRGFIQKEDPERVAIDINMTINDIADLLRSDAREHGATVALELDRSLLPVFADSIQIQQVIVNLARNGIEAMVGNLPKQRLLTINTSACQNDAVEISVHDTGVGIPAENLDRVFDSFFTTKTTGLGMGLSLSHSIIEAHGGRLWVTSDGETGTIFRFTLPITNESPDET
jgi:PAS domain S-box-containing protein